jgi:hypothetical protein
MDDDLIGNKPPSCIDQVLELQIELLMTDLPETSVTRLVQRRVLASKRRIEALLQFGAGFAADEIADAKEELAFWELLSKADPKKLQCISDRSDPANLIADIVKGQKTVFIFEPVSEKEIGFPPDKPWLGCRTYEQFGERIENGSIRLLPLRYVGMLFWDQAWSLAQLWELPGTPNRGKRRISDIFEEWKQIVSAVQAISNRDYELVAPPPHPVFDPLGFGKCERLKLSTVSPLANPAKPATINQRMLEKMHNEPDCVHWSVQKWADHLDCAKSTVAETPAWHEIRRSREKIRAQAEEQLRKQMTERDD